MSALKPRGFLLWMSRRLPLRIVSSANLREHWAVKAKRTKAHRSAGVFVGKAIKRVAMPYGGPDSVAVTLTRVAPRPLDTHDNLRSGFKAFVDGVAEGLGVDDSTVLWEYQQRRGEPKEYAVEVDARVAP
jgi:hypothetical protein